MHKKGGGDSRAPLGSQNTVSSPKEPGHSASLAPVALMAQKDTVAALLSVWPAAGSWSTRVLSCPGTDMPLSPAAPSTAVLGAQMLPLALVLQSQCLLPRVLSQCPYPGSFPVPHWMGSRYDPCNSSLTLLGQEQVSSSSKEGAQHNPHALAWTPGPCPPEKHNSAPSSCRRGLVLSSTLPLPPACCSALPGAGPAAGLRLRLRPLRRSSAGSCCPRAGSCQGSAPSVRGAAQPRSGSLGGRGV